MKDPEKPGHFIADHIPMTAWAEIARRLSLGQTQADVCRALGRSQPAMSQLIRRPEFRVILEEAQLRREEHMYDVMGHVKSRLPDACNVLDEILDDPDAGYKVKLSAADRIFKLTGHGQTPREVNVDQRTQTFEQTINQIEDRHPESSTIVGGLDVVEASEDNDQEIHAQIGGEVKKLATEEEAAGQNDDFEQLLEEDEGWPTEGMKH